MCPSFTSWFDLIHIDRNYSQFLAIICTFVVGQFVFFPYILLRTHTGVILDEVRLG